jgi:hypothetical protein
MVLVGLVQAPAIKVLGGKDGDFHGWYSSGAGGRMQDARGQAHIRNPISDILL